MNNSDQAQSAQAELPSAEEPQAAGAVNIEKLAEKVYRLMLEDLRLERARGLTGKHNGK